MLNVPNLDLALKMSACELLKLHSYEIKFGDKTWIGSIAIQNHFGCLNRMARDEAYFALRNRVSDEEVSALILECLSFMNTKRVTHTGFWQVVNNDVRNVGPLDPEALGRTALRLQNALQATLVSAEITAANPGHVEVVCKPKYTSLAGTMAQKYYLNQ